MYFWHDISVGNPPHIYELGGIVRSHLKTLNTKNTTAYVDGNTGPGLGQAQQRGGG
jgi:hypothetical protein